MSIIESNSLVYSIGSVGLLPTLSEQLSLLAGSPAAVRVGDVPGVRTVCVLVFPLVHTVLRL